MKGAKRRPVLFGYGKQIGSRAVIWPMFDAHCHLQDQAFNEDRDTMLAESHAAGVSHLLIPATDVASFDGTLALTKNQDVYCGLGIHPHSATEWSEAVRDRIVKETQSNPKIVAIGEIGLDYYYDFSPRDVQVRAFTQQIELAQQLRKPIAVHTRESEEDVYSIIAEHYRDQPAELPRGQFHCFSADLGRMHQAVELGFYVSFTGNITFKKSTLGEVVKETPLDRILIETDSPYLPPVPHRGKRNSPVYLRLVAEKIAEIKQMDVSIIMQRTFENAMTLFRIPRTLAVVALLSLSFIASSALAQRPAGSAPPDSVLTGDRRKAEELRKKQQEELAREEAQRKLDSTRAAAQEQETEIAKAREQMRQDSIRAAERVAEEERHAAFLQTPMPWRSIGLGASGGIGNIQLGPIKPVSTSVFAYTIQASTQLTRRLDFDLSFSRMTIGDILSSDSIYNYGPGTPPSGDYNPSKSFKPVDSSKPLGYRYSDGTHNYGTRLIQSEDFHISWWSADFRYTFTRPASYIKFFLDVGYTYFILTNQQHYLLMKDTVNNSGEFVDERSYNRQALKIGIGAKHEFELSSKLTLEPFIQAAIIGMFNGQHQDVSFMYVPADPVIMTHVNAGLTLYFGFYGVPRD